MKSNMVEYYKTKYNITIKDKDQALLYVNKNDQTLYFPVSLCNVASLPQDFTKDARKMRDLQKYKISNPNDRFDRISKLLSRLVMNEVFEEWGLRVQQNMT